MYASARGGGQAGGVDASAVDVSKDQLSPPELLALADEVLVRHFADSPAATRRVVSPRNLAALCLVESSGRPKAKRYEEHLDESSTGLCQTLLSTCRWLSTDLGYTAHGRGEDITDKTLEDPRVSLYFGAAYLTWLATYKGERRSDEFTFRGFNGGPNGINMKATNYYWEKQLKARKEIDAAAKGGSSMPQQAAAADTRSCAKTYTVKPGDTMWGISKSQGISVGALERANPGVDAGALAVGQTLNLP